MSDLAEKLLARLDEIEEIAQRAADVGIANWKPEDPSFWFDDETPMDLFEKRLIALHDPASALRHCAGHREIVEECQRIAASFAHPETLNFVDFVLARLARGYGLEVDG